MRAAVLEGIDFLVGIPHDNYRCFTNKGRAEITRLGDFRFQAQVVPDLAAIDALLFLISIGCVGIDTERHARISGPMPLDDGFLHVDS